PMPRDDVVGVQEALSEVGARLSDVFGADAIIWVEGPTEEVCFPLFLEAAGIELNSKLKVVALRNTGDFETKRRYGKDSAKAAWDIYQKLSGGDSLMPRALAFSLDREERSDEAVAELVKLSGGTISVLPRRVFENYLLHPRAIAEVLNHLPS